MFRKYLYLFLLVIVISSCTPQTIETNTPIPPTKTQIPNTVTPTLKPPTQTITVTLSKTPTVTPTKTNTTPTSTDTEEINYEDPNVIDFNDPGMDEYFKSEYLKKTGLSSWEEVKQTLEDDKWYTGRCGGHGYASYAEYGALTRQYVVVGVKDFSLIGLRDRGVAADNVRSLILYSPYDHDLTYVRVGYEKSGKWKSMFPFYIDDQRTEFTSSSDFVSSTEKLVGNNARVSVILGFKDESSFENPGLAWTYYDEYIKQIVSVEGGYSLKLMTEYPEAISFNGFHPNIRMDFLKSILDPNVDVGGLTLAEIIAINEYEQ